MTHWTFWRTVVIVSVCALLASAPLLAQSTATNGVSASSESGLETPVWGHDDEGRVVIHAVRTTERMHTDGRLDEAIYKTVPAIHQFIQMVPNNGAAGSERTEVVGVYDDENVYVACRCWDSHPERIVANDMRRGSPNLQKQDHLAITFDTLHDRRNGFMFYMTPNGAMREAAVTDDAPNHDWRTVWESKGARSDQGWTAEVAIPFKSLRYGPGHEPDLGHSNAPVHCQQEREGLSHAHGRRLGR